MNAHQKKESLTLEILETIANQDDLTQRHLANSLGVALGLANSYLKRCVRKGLVKIHTAPANRYLYYLTPKGFAEKSRLTAQYLSYSFDFYRQASDSCTTLFKYCQEKNMTRIVLCGISELAEIATLRATEHKIKLLGFYDSNATTDKYINKPVWKNIKELPEFDVCIITNLSDPHSMHSEISNYISDEIILIPSILGIKK